MKQKAVIIAGTHSGSGKTTVTLGLMAALRESGLRVAPFKCGPDFIDPSLHQLVTGCISRNLDLWMAGEEWVKHSFASGATADISIIEGVMGMFDGGPSSSAALAAELGVPVILVLDVRSTAESAAAVVTGFESLDPTVAPQGVILNMVAGERHLQLVSDAINKHCRAEILGYLPRTTDFSMPSRHLGLHMGEEAPLTSEKIATLSRTVREHIDLQRLLAIAEAGKQPAASTDHSPAPAAIRVGVARDRAFCFYYEDNLDILRAAGAEICPFSPLEETSLPADLDALYLGGGYPELYAEQLSGNTGMLDAIHSWAEENRPIYAECGGFMYLCRGITTLDNRFFPMAAVFPGKTSMQAKRAGLGYRQLTTLAPSFFGPEGTVLRGHEFHYSRVDQMESSIEKVYGVNNGTSEGYRYKNVLGGYMHLHFGFTPRAVDHFVHFCKG